MKIFWITKINQKKYYKTSRIEIAKALRDFCHSVTLITERGIGEKVEASDTIALPTIPCKIISRFLFGIILFFYLPLKLRSKKIDIILIDGANIWAPFLVSTKLLKIPIILDLRTLSTDKEFSTETLYYDSSIAVAKLIAKGFTTITPELKDFLIKRYKIPDEKIGIWTSGASKEFIESEKKSYKFSIIKKQKDIFYLMYHGTYEATRGLENVFEGIAKLPQELKEKIKFIVIGLDKKKIDELKIKSKKLGIVNVIVFIPAVQYSEIPYYLDLCDAGIIPLPPEYIWWHVSAPMKTLEYLSRSKPIIATNIPFHKRIFEKGECGILIKNADTNTIRDTIIKLMQDNNRLVEMGKTGRYIIEKYYTWHHSARDLEEFIGKMV